MTPCTRRKSLIAISPYLEGTVTKVSDLLVLLHAEATTIAREAGLQFRLQHVRAHGADLNSSLVDSMCTAVIEANDMKTQTQGPTQIAPFYCRDNCAAPPSLIHHLMTKPSQISDELVDRLTSILFDEIFQTPSK
jgi:hypothetical protein